MREVTGLPNGKSSAASWELGSEPGTCFPEWIDDSDEMRG